ncbi:MAG: glucokinase [Nanoarchaeota archaeon]
MTIQYLIGDICGTNSTLAIIDKKNNFKIIKKKTFKTNNFKDIEEIIAQFFKNNIFQIQICILSIAGNIKNNNNIKLTNSNINVNINKIKQKFLFEKIIIINDFYAIANTIENINPKQIKIINKVKNNKNNHDNKIVVGAGTGLGFATLIYNKQNNSYIIKESEAGHKDFSIHNQEELKLTQFIKNKYNKKNIQEEDLVSGKGIQNIYEFFTNKKLPPEKIFELKNIDKNAKKTFNLFFKFYARVIKNYAISELALGGIYIAGGIITKNQKISKKDFLKEFTKNDTYSLLLKNIPIYIIIDYEISLYGIIEYIKKENL